FLPFLGQLREWKAGRHCLDAGALLGLAFEKLRGLLPASEPVAAALPVYLTPPQVAQLTALATKARWNLRGTAALPLVLAAAEGRGPPLVLVVDADEFALTGALVVCVADTARLLASVALPRLGERAWKERLLDTLADRCVRLCRRDPRDSAAAEQALWEQL